MKITLTPEESETLFHTAMCNVFGTGYHNDHGLSLEYDAKEYEESRNNALREGVTTSSLVCFEDVLLQMLRDGKKISLIDEEGDGEYTRHITIKDVHEKVSKTPSEYLMDEINEDGDVTSSDAIIQTVFFDEIIFG